MNLRDVIGTVALAYLPLALGCPPCPDEEVEQTWSLQSSEAVELLNAAAQSASGASSLCLDVCSLGVVEGPPADVLSCLFDRETAELECVFDGEFGEERRRIPAGRVSTEDLRWPGALEDQLTAADSANPECVVELGERLDDLQRICLGPLDCSGAGRVGRSQLGLELTLRGSPRSRWWAQMTALEFAAVTAFEELAADLERLGAPADLVLRAIGAAEDERVHTRMCAAMAGVPVPCGAAAEHRPHRVASLLEFARVNAAQGCIRESFAALEALVQSQRARDPRARAVLKRIADDEVRHGQLSWDIDAWAAQRLSNRGMRLVQRSRRVAIRRTWTSLARRPTCSSPSDLAPGLPDAPGRQTLFRGFIGGLARSRAQI